MRKKKGGAAGDPWMGDRIAGPVTTMPSVTFESDKGIPANMQYNVTPASLAAVNVFEGGAKSSRLTRQTVIMRENAKLENKKIKDAVDALLRLKIDYQPAKAAKAKKVTFSKKKDFKTADGYEVTRYSSASIDLNKTPSKGGKKKSKK